MPTKQSVLGDSISTFQGLIPSENRWYYDGANTNGTGVTRPEDTWWAQVIASDGGELLANASFSGSMVQGSGFPAARSLRRAAQLRGPEGEEPDVVWVFIGINDYGWGSPEAQVGGGSEAAPKGVDGAPRAEGDGDSGAGIPTDPDAASMEVEFGEVDPAGPAPDDAADRFGVAYREMLANVRDQAPEAEIRCLTILPGRKRGAKGSTHCYNLRGVPFDDYNDQIRMAAVETGAMLVDVRALGYDYESADGTHPDAMGMRQLAQLVSAALAMAQGREDEAATALVDYPADLRSSCGCDLTQKGGCLHADRQRTRWSCVRKDANI